MIMLQTALEERMNIVGADLMEVCGWWMEMGRMKDEWSCVLVGSGQLYAIMVGVATRQL